MKKLMKSKKGVIQFIAPILFGLVGLLFGIPVFITWLKMITQPSTPFSPIWIIVIAFIVLILLFRRK